jgi:peptidoglycan/xylan/chitin deacetylase (PgdA/CDA1 family)
MTQAVSEERFLYDDIDISWIDPTKPMVAFTFDDGPVGTGETSSAQIIQDALTQAGAHATFFYIGSQINNADKEKEIVQAVERGFEVANHSLGWSGMAGMTAEEVIKSVSITDSMLNKLTGFTNFLFRAPNLSTSKVMFDVIKKPFIHCAVDSHDWQFGKTKEEIIANVQQARDGDIILMHETQKATAEAVPELLKFFADKDWQVVSVSELYAARNTALKVGVLNLSVPLSESDSPESDFTFNPATGMITEYTGLGGDVVIPTTIGGLPVTAIGYRAFEKSSLTSVVIPSGVTSIGLFAFAGCSSLTRVDLPNSVTSIGPAAFASCSSLTSIDLPDSVTEIGDRMFYDCTSLTGIDLPNSVTSIGSSAFVSCSSLTNIDLPDSVIEIGDRTFYGCTSLTDIDLPKGLQTIREGLFLQCNELTTIDIPDMVTSIGPNAFFGCSSLISINLPQSITKIGEYAFECISSSSIIYVTTESVQALVSGSGFPTARIVIIETSPPIQEIILTSIPKVGESNNVQGQVFLDGADSQDFIVIAVVNGNSPRPTYWEYKNRLTRMGDTDYATFNFTVITNTADGAYDAFTLYLCEADLFENVSGYSINDTFMNGKYLVKKIVQNLPSTSVSGLVSSFNPNVATTLTLSQGNTKLYTMTIDATTGSGQVVQEFTFKDIASGTYTLTVNKPGHTSYTVKSIIIGGTNVDLTKDPRSGVSLITLLSGDLNGDGLINQTDLNILWLPANYNKGAVTVE